MEESFSVSVITLKFIYLHFYPQWNLIDANGKSEHSYSMCPPTETSEHQRKFILELLNSANELVLQHLPVTWRGAKSENCFARQEVVNITFIRYVCTAGSNSLQKLSHQETCCTVALLRIQVS